MLDWNFSGRGEWEAMSDNGYFFRIAVCDDGSFDVTESPQELIPQKVSCFDTLDGAKKFCQAAEDRLVTDAAVNSVAVHGAEVESLQV